jgi:hypothetical protein
LYCFLASRSLHSSSRIEAGDGRLNDTGHGSIGYGVRRGDVDWFHGESFEALGRGVGFEVLEARLYILGRATWCYPPEHPQESTPKPPLQTPCGTTP